MALDGQCFSKSGILWPVFLILHDFGLPCYLCLLFSYPYFLHMSVIMSTIEALIDISLCCFASYSVSVSIFS